MHYTLGIAITVSMLLMACDSGQSETDGRGDGIPEISAEKREKIMNRVDPMIAANEDEARARQAEQEAAR